MRSAALIFGLLAGLSGSAVIAFGSFESGLATVQALGPDRELLAKFIVYLIPNIGLLGAGLVLARPRLGAAFMLICAVGWTIAGLAAGHGAILFAALPVIFSGAGGLVAIFAARREALDEAMAPEGSLSERIPRWDETRNTRRRGEPELGSEVRGATRPRNNGPGNDYVDADEVFDEPEQTDQADPDDEAAAEAPPPFYDDEPEPESRPRRRRGWSLPEADGRQRQTPRNYVPERQQAQPERRQTARNETSRSGRRQASGSADFDFSGQDFSPPKRDFEPSFRSSRDYEEEDRPPRRQSGSYQNRDEDDDRRDRRRRRDTPLGSFLGLLVGLLVVMVVGGVLTATYLDYQRGPDSVLFGGHRATADAAQSPAATPATPAAGNAAPVVADATPPANANVGAVPGPVPLAPARLVAAPANPVVPQGGFKDPFEYCTAVNTVDAPDQRYTGPPVPTAIAGALQLPASAAAQVHWRCLGRSVLACDSKQGTACDLTPTVDVMVSYCAQHPNSQNIPAPNGSWSCNGSRPVIPRDQKWPVDARGFYPGAWRRLLTSAG